MPRFDTWILSTSSDDLAGHISSYRDNVMVQPGVLPKTPSIHPIKRISPSRFISLRECALREVWTANRQPSLLPTSPVAKLGTAIHKLLELAGKGQLGEGSAQEVDVLQVIQEGEQVALYNLQGKFLLVLSRRLPQQLSIGFFLH